jgi:hypothetical protein
MPPGVHWSQGIGPHGPLRSVDDTPTTASACQAHLRNTITAPGRERERHIGQPEARMRGAGPLALRGREARGAGLGAGTRVRERRTRSRLQARRVYRLANRSRKHAVCDAGTPPPARVGTARAGGVSPVAQAGCSSSVAAPPVEAGRAALGRGRWPTNDHRGGPIAAPSPPGRHRGRRQPASPRRAGSSARAAGHTKPSPSSSVETGCSPPKPARSGGRLNPRPSAPSDDQRQRGGQRTERSRAPASRRGCRVSRCRPGR